MPVRKAKAAKVCGPRRPVRENPVKTTHKSGKPTLKQQQQQQQQQEQQYKSRKNPVKLGRVVRTTRSSVAERVKKKRCETSSLPWRRRRRRHGNGRPLSAGHPLTSSAERKKRQRKNEKKNERKKKKQERIEAKQQKDAMSDAAHLRRRRQVLLRTVDSVFFG